MDDEALLATVGRGAEAEERRTEAKAFRGHRMAPTLPDIVVVVMMLGVVLGHHHHQHF